MKKLLDRPQDTVRDMLLGLAGLNPGLRVLADEDVAIAAVPDRPEDRPVALISGGGSGHEPAHAGYVGAGMLSAAVAGPVFTSPSADAVLAAIRAVAGPRGALLIVKNYTGDRLNFGLAAELARAEGIPVELVLVADDVSLRNTVGRSDRRGVAGTVFVHKIAGATAASGASLDEVVAAARATADAVGTMAVGLGPCIVPAAGKPGFELGEDEIELGLGIHGERGVSRGPMQPAAELVATILSTIVEDLGIKAGERVALLVNGLGGTPPMELAVVAGDALDWLREHSIDVVRAWSGNYMTALEMPGVSLTLCRLDDARLAALDAATEAGAWVGPGAVAEVQVIPAPHAETHDDLPEADPALVAALSRVGAACRAAEGELAEADSVSGDGDLGASYARAGEAIEDVARGARGGPDVVLQSVASVLRRVVGGSSGPFYAVALARAARTLQGETAIAPETAAKAFQEALQAITDLGGAKPGDRTMLDALHPAAEAFAANASKGYAAAWAAAAAAAARGAQDTTSMRPKRGRAAYLGERALGAPDAGALGTVVWLRALAG